MRSLSETHSCVYPSHVTKNIQRSLFAPGDTPDTSESTRQAAAHLSSAQRAAGGLSLGLSILKQVERPPLSPEEKRVLSARLEQRRAEGKTDSVPLPGAIRIDREATRLKRLKCSVLTAARLHQQQRSKWRVAMVTLTYRPDVEWAPGQISALVRHIRQYLARCGVSMRHVWVQEFTKKGKPHYHMLLWLPAGRTLPKPDKRGWWPWGFTKIEWARNAVGYIAKYASKGDSLHKPAKGARMHGNGGLTDECLLEQRWWKLPTWLREKADYRDGVRRAVSGTGGGFVNPSTGEVYRSPWVVVFHGGHVWIKPKREVTSDAV